MSAVACLRIFVGEVRGIPTGMDLANLVDKICSAYLESTWIWPRRFGLVAHFTFVLTDPRATALDARELQALARDLQLKLFGDQGLGDIHLLLLEGAQTEVMRFAGARPEELQAVLNGGGEAFAGRLCKITPTEARAIAPPGASVEGRPPPDILATVRPPAPVAGQADPIESFRLLMGAEQVRRRRSNWIGLYAFGPERFVGSSVLPNAGASSGLPEELTLQNDLAGIDLVAEAARRGETGFLFANLAFDALVRRSGRDAFVARLANAPPDEGRRLGVTVRQVPREPSYAAMREISALLHPTFTLLDLNITDPDFRVLGLPRSHGVTSVVLVLEHTDAQERLSKIRRFAEHRDAYRQKRVWQGVAGLRTQREVNLCKTIGMQLGSGPAVSEPADAPYELARWPMAELPRRPGEEGLATAPPG